MISEKTKSATSLPCLYSVFTGYWLSDNRMRVVQIPANCANKTTAINSFTGPHFDADALINVLFFIIQAPMALEFSRSPPPRGTNAFAVAT